MSYKNIISNRFNFEEIRGKVRENLRKIGDSIGGSGGYCGKFKKKEKESRDNKGRRIKDNKSKGFLN